MKMRFNPEHYNGQKLGPDDFAYSEHFTEIAFPCPKRKFQKCIQRITQGDANQEKAQWHWDGNIEEPTLSPSIGCDARCGWHGHIINGEIKP
mgnify:FL=1